MKTVLVTGAGRGIGLAIARDLARRGYKLALVTKSVQSAEALRAEEFGDSIDDHDVYQVDLGNAGEVETFTVGWQTPLWAIINNAGIFRAHSILNHSGPDIWEELIRTNLTAPYELTKRLLPHLTRPGRVVNIASQLGVEGRAGFSAYCASKSGLIALTKCWAKEFGEQGITVNAVCPGWVDTEMTQEDLQYQADQLGVRIDSYRNDVCRPLELKRFNTPVEVASLVAYLVSEEASGVSGRDWLMQTVSTPP